jgi:hypothetical protein
MEVPCNVTKEETTEDEDPKRAPRVALIITLFFIGSIVAALVVRRRNHQKMAQEKALGGEHRHGGVGVPGDNSAVDRDVVITNYPNPLYNVGRGVVVVNCTNPLYNVSFRRKQQPSRDGVIQNQLYSGEAGTGELSNNADGRKAMTNATYSAVSTATGAPSREHGHGVGLENCVYEGEQLPTVLAVRRTNANDAYEIPFREETELGDGSTHLNNTYDLTHGKNGAGVATSAATVTTPTTPTTAAGHVAYAVPHASATAAGAPDVAILSVEEKGVYAVPYASATAFYTDTEDADAGISSRVSEVPNVPLAATGAGDGGGATYAIPLEMPALPLEADNITDSPTDSTTYGAPDHVV